MAYSIQDFIASSSSTYPLSMQYLDPAHLRVTVDGVPRVYGVDYTVPSRVLTFSSAPTVGAAIRVLRSTPKDALPHVFAAGAPFRDDTVDDNNTALLYIGQESVEQASFGAPTTDLDMLGHGIRNVAAAVDPTDVPNLAQVTAQVTSGTAAVVAAHAASGDHDARYKLSNPQNEVVVLHGTGMSLLAQAPDSGTVNLIATGPAGVHTLGLQADVLDVQADSAVFQGGVDFPNTPPTCSQPPVGPHDLVNHEYVEGHFSLVTGVVSGCEHSVTLGSVAFSVSSGTVREVHTNYPNPETHTDYPYVGAAASDLYPSAPSTYVGIQRTSGNVGELVQQTTPFTNTQLLSIAPVAVLAKSGGVIIASAPIPVASYAAGRFPFELYRALGPITSGCVYSGIAGLQLQRTSGSIFRAGSNYAVSKQSPNTVELPAQSPVQFSAYSRNGSNVVFSSSAVLSTFTVNRYDNGGASSGGIPAGVVSTNSWQAMRVWLSPNGYTLVQYGTATYASADAAKAGYASEVFYPAPILSTLPFRGILLVRGAAANFADAGDMVFIPAGKLGDVGAATAGGGSSSAGHVPIQFQDEGASLGTIGTVDTVNFTGIASASRAGNTVTVDVPDTAATKLPLAGGILTGALTISAGDLTFSGTAQRIRGDFSAATIPARTVFQTTVANASSIICAIPNGTGTVSAFTAANSSAGDNCAVIRLACESSAVKLSSRALGTGTTIPLQIDVNSVTKMSFAETLATSTTAWDFSSGYEVRFAGTPGTAGQVLTSAGPGLAPTWQAAAAGGGITLLAPWTSTSGTLHDWTIPSTAKRITVTFAGVSTNGAANLLVQIGTGAVPATSGYLGACSYTTTGTATANLSTGIRWNPAADVAANTYHGRLVLEKLTGGTWVFEGKFARSDGAAVNFVAGSKDLGGVLDVLRVTTTNGTDTFDAGLVGVTWE